MADKELTRKGDNTTLPRGIQTYEGKSEAIARKLARDSRSSVIERKRLGEQLIRESTEAFKSGRRLG
jgi:hypothetical protein